MVSPTPTKTLDYLSRRGGTRAGHQDAMRGLLLLLTMTSIITAVPALATKFFKGSVDVKASGAAPIKSLKVSIELCQV